MTDLAYFDAFVQRLRAHDWHWEKADDFRAWKAGQAEQYGIQRAAADDPVLQDLIAAARAGTVTITTPWLDYAARVRAKLAGGSTADAPTDTRRLAKIVHTLAIALARADPDNRAPKRALDALQSMGLLQSAITAPAAPPAAP